MSSQKLKRRQTIQPSFQSKLIPSNLVNKLSVSNNNSHTSLDSVTSKDKSQTQQQEPPPIQTSLKKPQTKKSVKGILSVPKDNPNQQTNNDKQSILLGGDNTNSSVYDKYKKNFAKLLLQGIDKEGNKKTKEEEQDSETQGATGVNKLTPMPQLQKKGTSNNVNKDVFAKAERSAVVMRRMEYNAKLVKRKVVRKSTQKLPSLSKVKFIQRMIRGFLIRKKIINKSKYFRRMIKAIRLKNLPQQFRFFIKQTKPSQPEQKIEIKTEPLPIIEEVPSPKNENPPLQQEEIIHKQIEKIFENISCQTSFIIEPEETPKEKYLDLISGGTSKSKNASLNGIKTFPRLKVELGNNEKLLKKMYKRLNKLTIDEMQIDTKQKVEINLNTQDDNAVNSVIKKLLDLRLDTTSSPRNSEKINEIQNDACHNEISSAIQGNKTIAYVRSLIKFKVTFNKPMFISKKIYTHYQQKMKERKYMKIKLFIIVLSHLSTKQIRKYVLYIMKKKCCVYLTRNKSTFSIFSIEDEVDDFDEVNMQKMKRNATIELNPLKHRKTCYSTISKEISSDNNNNYEDEDDVEYINGD